MLDPVFNKVAGLQPATLSKKKLWNRFFLLNFVKFLRATFFKEHLLLVFDSVEACTHVESFSLT